jgi:hypothetical protein
MAGGSLIDLTSDYDHLLPVHYELVKTYVHWTFAKRDWKQVPIFTLWTELKYFTVLVKDQKLIIFLLNFHLITRSSFVVILHIISNVFSVFAKVNEAIIYGFLIKHASVGSMSRQS